jgi:UDP-N-acetylmuramyl pentapeptide phosphotransferase/UDP-N-acetylglucosamine-1-phosphate transferase
VKLSSRGIGWGADSDFSGPQKFHKRAVPRLGGVGIFVAVSACALFAGWQAPLQSEMLLLLACAVPALAYGLAEDLTLAISPRKRMIAAAGSALLGAFVIDAVISRTNIDGVDGILAFSACSIALTVFAVAGLANAVNIIDGFNGLASMVCMLMFAVIAYVAHVEDDQFILVTALCCLGALAGFFAWNFPRGLIFLGDGGAYFSGFMLAELALLLVHRHQGVSPWFALLLFFYPTLETAFSIYRRKFVKGVSVASPDAAHLHSLIFRRLLHCGSGGRRGLATSSCNPATSVYLWLLSLLSLIPAALFWYSTPLLVLFTVLFAAAYLWLYTCIVQFKTPVWLLPRRTSDQSLYVPASAVRNSAQNPSLGDLPRL